MPRTILVVDPDETTAKTLDATADHEQFKILRAADALAARRMIEDAVPDAIISEVPMAGLDGYEFCQKIHSDSRSSGVLFVFLSSKSDPQDKIRGLKEGADEYLTKPFSVDEVLTRIQTGLARLDGMKQHVIIDQLTGLHTRGYFDIRLNEETEKLRRYNRPFTVAILDVDGFKAVNESQGHLIGDAVLKRIGQLLKTEMRVEDVTARFGGDEFAVVLTETPLDWAKLALERIRVSVEATRLQLRGEVLDLRTTVSIGLASLENEDDRDTEKVVALAEKALQAAKEAGRNRVSP